LCFPGTDRGHHSTNIPTFSHVTRLENMVRWRWTRGDVVIWDNRATQHNAVYDYGHQPRIVFRVTIDVADIGRHRWPARQETCSNLNDMCSQRAKLL